jgi:hypothetical protein
VHNREALFRLCTRENVSLLQNVQTFCGAFSAPIQWVTTAVTLEWSGWCVKLGTQFHLDVMLRMKRAISPLPLCRHHGVNKCKFTFLTSIQTVIPLVTEKSTGYERDRSWPNLRYYPSIIRKEMRKVSARQSIVQYVNLPALRQACQLSGCIVRWMKWLPERHTVTQESVVDTGVNFLHSSDTDQHFDMFCGLMH